MRFAVLDKSGGVVNVIEAPEDWTPETGYTFRESIEASPGDRFEGDVLVRAEEVEHPATIQEQYDAASTDSERIIILAKALNLRTDNIVSQ